MIEGSVINKKEIFVLAGLLLVALAVLVIVFFDVSKIKDKVQTVIEPFPIQKEDNLLPIFYHFKSYDYISDDVGPGSLYIYQLSSDLNENDRLVKKLDTEYEVVDSSGGKAVLVYNKAKMFLLDLLSGEMNPVAGAIAEDRILGDVKLISDKDILVYISTKNNNSEISVDSYLHILNLVTGDRKDLFLKDSSPLYSGFFIRAVSDDLENFILVEGGGDGGGAWSKGYFLDIQSGSLTYLDPITEESSFWEDDRIPGFYNPLALGLLNDNGTKSAFVERVDYDKQDIVNDKSDYLNGCLKEVDLYKNKGQAINVVNLQGENLRMIYTNLEFENNFCHNRVRRVDNLLWLDNETILFSTPSAIFKAHADGSFMEMIYEFERIDDPKTVSRPIISQFYDHFVMFDDGAVIDLDTDKIIKVAGDKNISRVNFLRNN